MTKNFEAAVKESVFTYAKEVTALAIGNSESSRIKATINSKIERKGRNHYLIRTRAGGPKAQDAAAREFGSGIHSRRGPRKKYPIRPRNAGGVLVFPWDKASDLIPKTKDGRVILKKVMHPGVQADKGGRGYIGPAVKVASKSLKKRLLKDGATGIRMDMRVAFKGAIVR